MRTQSTQTTERFLTRKLFNLANIGRHIRLNSRQISSEGDFNGDRNFEKPHGYSTSRAIANSLKLFEQLTSLATQMTFNNLIAGCRSQLRHCYNTRLWVSQATIVKLFTRSTSWTTMMSLNYSHYQCFERP